MSIPRRKSRRSAINAACAALKGQPLRLVQYLDDRGAPVLTGEVAAACAIGNVSDAACRANAELEPLGYRIVARLPRPLTKNRFGERSLAHEWSIQRVR